jgi:hypothetical protein
MELLTYLILKKNNIIYYEVYKKKILFYLIFSAVFFISIYFIIFYSKFFLNEINFLLIILTSLPTIFFIKTILKIRRKNNRLIFYLEELYKKDGNILIGDYNYINEFLLKTRGCTLNKNDYFIKSIVNQLDLICEKWSKELDEKI